MFGILLMLKNSPADTKKKPIVNRKRRRRLKILSAIISIIYSILSIILKNQIICNYFLLSLILQNIMISPFTYKIFNQPYNNYITFLKEHPDFIN